MTVPMSFLWPQYLWLLLLPPLLVLVYVWLLRRRKQIVLRYADIGLVRQAVGPRGHWRRHVPPALLLTSLSLALLAASRPLAVVTLPSDHATIMLVMDVSMSMRAKDIEPNRLVAAQEAAKAFLTELPRAIKVGIVTFAGTAQLVQPPTLNREDLVAAIDRFQMQRGTAIGTGIVVALSELFPDHGLDVEQMIYGGGKAERSRAIDETQPAKPKKEFVPVAPGSYESAVMVMLTDGRRTTGIDTLEAAKMAADRGVRVYSIGLGTVDGIATDMGGGWSMYLRLDEPSLKAVAHITQAEYYIARDAAALKKVYEKLGTRLQIDRKETEISALLALAAAILAITAAGLSLRWFHRIV